MHCHKYNRLATAETSKMLAEIPEGLKKSGAVEVHEKLGTISVGNILDVGTQKGGFIRTLMKTLKDYSSFIGIDILEENIETAKEDFKNDPASFYLMDAENLDFKDKHFDCVCISHSLHHLTNIQKVLREMLRVLKPGGYFIIQESFSDDDQTKAQLAEIDAHTLDAEVDRLLGIPHYKTKTRQELHEIFDSLDLKNVDFFETSRYVHCLFCEDAPDCEDPKNKRIVDFALKDVDEIIERAKDLDVFKDVKTKAEVIKDRILSDGTTPASVLYFFGTK